MSLPSVSLHACPTQRVYCMKLLQKEYLQWVLTLDIGRRYHRKGVRLGLHNTLPAKIY